MRLFRTLAHASPVVGTTLLAMLLLLPTLLSSAIAEESPLQPVLGEIRSFAVQAFQPGFDEQNYRIEGDWNTFLNRALQEETRLPKATPAQAYLDFFCPEPNCMTLLLQVHAGQQGPVVWESSIQRRDWGSQWKVDAKGVKTPDQLAQEAISELATAYTNSSATLNGAQEATAAQRISPEPQ